MGSINKEERGKPTWSWISPLCTLRVSRFLTPWSLSMCQWFLLSRLNNIPLYVYTSLFLHLPVNGYWGCFHPWLLWIMLLWTQLYTYSFATLLSILVVIYSEVKLLDHMLRHVTPEYFNMQDLRMRLFCCVPFFFLYGLKVQIIVTVSWHPEFAF